MPTPANATRLMAAIAAVDKGDHLVVHDLIEPEDFVPVSRGE